MKKVIYSRRQFLKYLSAGTATAFFGSYSHLLSALKSPKIAEIEVFPVNYPMTGRFKFFEGPEGHIIGRAAAIIKITADDGTIGWGESVPIPKWSYETLESVTTTIRNEACSMWWFTLCETSDRNFAGCRAHVSR